MKHKKEHLVNKIKIIDILNNKIVIFTRKQIDKLTEMLNINVKNKGLLLLIIDILFEDFKNCELHDCQHMGLIDKGHPDYIVRTTNNQNIRESMFVELKNIGDSIRISQIEWILNNPDKKTIIIAFE